MKTFVTATSMKLIIGQFKLLSPTRAGKVISSASPLRQLFWQANTNKCCSLCHIRKFSTNSSSKDVTVQYRNGLPVISVNLPSRKELCDFTLRPITSTVGDFIDSLKEEDRGIDRAAIFTKNGNRIAASTQISYVLQEEFVLMVNDTSYTVIPPVTDPVSPESSQSLDSAKSLVAKLYAQLNVETHQLQQERELQHNLESLKLEMAPLQLAKEGLAQKAANRTKYVMWGGLAYMGLQFGVLARLTWWEYSWDIMEPVTYFITYGTAIGMYGYFLLTQQEYLYPDVRDRQYLRFFHREAENKKFDIDRYNDLYHEINQAERDLKRLRDPLQLNLPIQQLSSDDDDSSNVKAIE